MCNSSTRGGWRVAIVDGQPLYRQGLAALVRTIPDVVEALELDGTAHLGPLLRGQTLDLLMADPASIRIPPPELLSWIPADRPPFVVFITADLLTLDLPRAIARGARAIISKAASREVIEAAVVAVLNGNFVLPGEAFAFLKTAVGSAERIAPPVHARLTGRERQVLELVTRGKRNREIADVLELSPRTVEGHVARAMEKLGCRTRGEAILRLLPELEPPRLLPVESRRDGLRA